MTAASAETHTPRDGLFFRNVRIVVLLIESNAFGATSSLKSKGALSSSREIEVASIADWRPPGVCDISRVQTSRIEAQSGCSKPAF
jgi:hypothetical protein